MEACHYFCYHCYSFFSVSMFLKLKTILKHFWYTQSTIVLCLSSSNFALKVSSPPRRRSKSIYSDLLHKVEGYYGYYRYNFSSLLYAFTFRHIHSAQLFYFQAQSDARSLKGGGSMISIYILDLCIIKW